MTQLTAKDLMTERIEAIPETLSVRDLASFLVDNEITGAPVEDRSGQLVGVVSLTDIARSTSEGGAELAERRTTFYLPDYAGIGSAEELSELHIEDDDLKVSDIMTPMVMAVQGRMPVSQVARAMLDGHVHRLLVIDDDRVVGILSSTDLLRALAEN